MSNLKIFCRFFRVFQISGILPFRMEIDATTGNFSKFSYSLKYPITWWCVITSIISTVFFVFLIEEFFSTSDELEDLPSVITVTTKTEIILNTIIILSNRYWLVLQSRNLTKAIKFMKKIETHPGANDYQNSMKFRITFGAIFISLGVSILLGEEL